MMGWAAFILAMQEEVLSEPERDTVSHWLSIINVTLLVLIVGLFVLALAVRVVAKRSTRPCPWCMEFISKKETICSRCGKHLAQL